jgi:hypothetical protein
MASEDGGPAFPWSAFMISDTSYQPITQGGMTLRDWLAGQALAGICAGICANPPAEKSDPSFDRAWGRVGISDAAKDAYHLADAMLAARKDKA